MKGDFEQNHFQFQQIHFSNLTNTFEQNLLFENIFEAVGRPLCLKTWPDVDAKAQLWLISKDGHFPSINQQIRKDWNIFLVTGKQTYADISGWKMTACGKRFLRTHKFALFWKICTTYATFCLIWPSFSSSDMCIFFNSVPFNWGAKRTLPNIFTWIRNITVKSLFKIISQMQILNCNQWYRTIKFPFGRRSS